MLQDLLDLLGNTLQPVMLLTNLYLILLQLIINALQVQIILLHLHRRRLLLLPDQVRQLLLILLNIILKLLIQRPQPITLLYQFSVLG